MKRKLILSLILLLSFFSFFFFSFPTHAQINTNIHTSNNSLSSRCTFTNDGFVDHCPTHRSLARNINISAKKLFEIYETYTSQDAILTKIILQQDKISDIQKVLSRSGKRNTQQENTIFMLSYIDRLFERYARSLGGSKTIIGTAQDLFKKTYYDKIQENLSLTNITLYQRQNIAIIGDRELPGVQFTFRNYNQVETMSQIDDIYCFSTLGDDEYVIPLDLPNQAFLPNTISHIIATMPLQDTRLTNFPGKRTLSCQLTYMHNGEEQTTEFVSMDITVE